MSIGPRGRFVDRKPLIVSRGTAHMGGKLMQICRHCHLAILRERPKYIANEHTAVRRLLMGCVILNAVKNQVPYNSAEDSDSSLRSE